MVRVGDMQYTLVARVPATVVTGQGTADELAKLPTIFPSGWNTITTDCAHDATCLFRAAVQSSNFASNPCSRPGTVTAEWMFQIQFYYNQVNSADFEASPGFDSYQIDPIPALSVVTSTTEWLPIE